MSPPVNIVSINLLRKGVSRIMRSNLSLFDSQGNLVNDRLVDAILDSDTTRIAGLANEFGYNPEIFASILSDASMVPKIFEDGSLYLETLIKEANRIPLFLKSNESKTNYAFLPKDVKNKLASFLYRPVKERQLTYVHKSKTPYFSMG
jgi:hypothetical protein